MSSGYVYFVACKDPYCRELTPHLKIGYTYDLKTRLRDLQCGSPVELCYMGYIETEHPIELERYLHIIFRKDLKHGEWHDVTRSMIDKIMTYPVQESLFEDFFLGADKPASKEVVLLRSEISMLRDVITKKDAEIIKLKFEDPLAGKMSNRAKKKAIEKFKFECLTQNMI